MKSRNVLVILCDQLRRDYLPMYGCRGLATPNLDRIAKLGVVFDRAISASPVCGPSRASMMTGRYPSDHGVWTNDVPFRDGLDYVAERMNRLGYRTGAFGKLHHTPGEDVKGFGEHALFEEGRLGDREPYLRWLKARHPEAAGVWNHRNHRFDLDEESYYEHWITSRAIDFIAPDVSANNVQPFFAWVSFQGPHGPYDPPGSVAGTCDPENLPPVVSFDRRDHVNSTLASRSARVDEKFKDRASLDRLRQAYAEMIVFIDRQIGRLLDALEAAGQFDHTTIVFTADHGEMLGDHGLEQKGPFPYRQHLEVPLMVANHPKLPMSVRSNALVGTIDVPGTVLDVAGDDQPIGHSRSLLGSAGGMRPPLRKVNFSEFGDAFKLVEDEQFRLAYYPFTSRITLHRPVQDPELTTNLAADPTFAPQVAAMLANLVDFQLLAKGTRIEAHDLVREQQDGLADMDPAYAGRLPLAFPLTPRNVRQLEAERVDATYNRVFEGREPECFYAPPYWQDAETL